MSVTAPRGFVAGGGHAGVKDPTEPDLAIVATEDGAPAPAAGVFTSNRLVAAPVQVSRDHLRVTGGRATAVVLVSGNANAATGEQGLADAERMCAITAGAAGWRSEEVLVCSTGLIGRRLPMQALEAGIPTVAAALGRDGAVAAADAILTTDTCRKEVVVEGDGFRVGGMAKGAAMIAPRLATMLAVLTTDAQVERGALYDVLHAAADVSFNAMTIDGAESTNDTVLLLANGAAGPVPTPALRRAVSDACGELATKMVDDAEGSTKTVVIEVKGAATADEARLAARRVAESQLVKCSWYGRDPYWGRVASELGSAGVAFEASRLSIRYGGVLVADGGVQVPHDADAVAAAFGDRRVEIIADLGVGDGGARLLTCDLTHDYVDENKGTS